MVYALHCVEVTDMATARNVVDLIIGISVREEMVPRNGSLQSVQSPIQM